MYLIELFGTKIKPRITRGKGMWKPIETGWLNDDILAIRDKDVNCFLIRAGNGYIAVDSGYKNSENVRNALKKYGISRNSVKSVLLTHLDIDHAGGMDTGSDLLFQDAQVYLSQEEAKYLTGEYSRNKVAFYSCKLPITLPEKTKTFAFGEKFYLDEVPVEAVSAIGHTLGHTAYLIADKYFFSGDCMIAGKDGGYCFYDFWNADSVLNIYSLNKLREFCIKRELDELITSHSGIIKIEDAFRHYCESPQWKVKGFHFIDGAEDNPYDMDRMEK